MSFKPCLLIPIYNHKDSIGHTVERLVPCGLPIFIVDDGSDQATQDRLAGLAQLHARVRLLRLPVNGGKGGAVMHGLRAAQQAGFSHALQIDADGQHDAADVPRFLERGAARPEAVICGQARYDASVPRARLYGRYVTHFWVWVETLSFTIRDTMCGFRLYPLAATCALLDEGQLPTRMDFDIAIAVHLAWRGLAFENLPTHVTYPVDGVSHFAPWRDNVRITKMHTRLFFGMLARLPLLLGRKVLGQRSAAQHWSQLTERSSGIGLRITYQCYRWLGARTARWLLYPIVGYFFLFVPGPRRASRDYLRRIALCSGAPPPRWRDTWQHLFAFAESGLDKLVAWMGDIDPAQIDFADRALFDAVLASGRGAVLLGAHLGNLEMARALATGQQLAVVNAVVYTQHAQQFNRMLAWANPRFEVNLVQLSKLGPATAIRLQDKIDRGELLAIFGDRTPPVEGGASERVSEVEFLGAPASFAHGPLILASLLDCPVYLFFCLREGDRYRIHFELFAQRVELPRRERQQRLTCYLQRYAQRLQAHCLKAPFQWFNFYDFWRPNFHNNASTGSNRV